MRVFDKATRRKIKKRIKTLKAEGLAYEAITETLRSEGVTSPSGAQLSIPLVRSLGRSAGIRCRGRRRDRKRDAVIVSQAVVQHRPTAVDESEVLIDIVLAADVSDSQKLSIIKTLRSTIK